MTLQAISLFCGAGFADYALEQAAQSLGIEIKIIAAYDFWDEAVSVYNRNLSSMAKVMDIKTIDKLPKVDFIFGGPPCQPFSIAGKKLGNDDPRNMMAKTIELTQGQNYLIENVKQVMDSPYITKLKASEYGDCTQRARVFHSTIPLNHIPVIFDKTYIKDIRDHSEDERILKKRGMAEKAGDHQHYSDNEPFQSLTAHTWHGHDVRGYGKLLPLSTRPHSQNIRKYNEDEQLGAVVGNTWHGNPESQLNGCRNPSLLEMQRAHSIPDNWNWGKVTKTDKGKMIANGWPIKMGISVFTRFLLNLIEGGPSHNPGIGSQLSLLEEN